LPFSLGSCYQFSKEKDTNRYKSNKSTKIRLAGAKVAAVSNMSELEELREKLKRYEFDEKEINKSPKTFEKEIEDALPDFTNDFKSYDLAVKLVGERHDKYDLVDLVNWLLARIKKLDKKL
jgi:hypothetical protein